MDTFNDVYDYVNGSPVIKLGRTNKKPKKCFKSSSKFIFCKFTHTSGKDLIIAPIKKLLKTNNHKA